MAQATGTCWEGTFFDTLGGLVLPEAPIFRDCLWKALGKKGCRFAGIEKDNTVWASCPVTTCRPGLQGGKRIGRVSTDGSAAHRLRDSEEKGPFIYLLHFLQGLKANQGTDPLQSRFLTLNILESTSVFISFPGTDSEMILQALKTLHNLSVSYLNYRIEKQLSRLERERCTAEPLYSQHLERGKGRGALFPEAV